jgi:MSHA biogenesis protein MshN
MSVVNQMLRDLESRRASGAILPDQVRVLPAARKFELPWWLLDIVVAVALIGLVGWQSNDPSSARAQGASSAQTFVDSASPPDAAALRPALDLESAPVNVATTVQPQAPVTIKPPLATSSIIDAGPPAQPVRGRESVLTKTAPADTTLLIASAKPTAVAPKNLDISAELNVQSAPAPARIDKRAQQLTPQQMAENEYRDAANLLNQGLLAQAQEGFRRALEHNPAHAGARQGLFGLLLDAKKNGEAEQVLEDGVKHSPNQPGFAMALARLRVDRGDTNGAIDTLQKTAPAALASPDYLAFLAALMQRQSRHQEAVEQFRAALRLAPGSGVWLMGLGISLQALNRNSEAQDAFRRARETNTLNPELQAFVDQRLKQLR